MTGVFSNIGKFYFLLLEYFHALVPPVTKRQEPFSVCWEQRGDCPEVSGEGRAGIAGDEELSALGTSLLRVGADLRRGSGQMAFDFLMSQCLEWVG